MFYPRGKFVLRKTKHKNSISAVWTEDEIDGKFSICYHKSVNSEQKKKATDYSVTLGKR